LSKSRGSAFVAIASLALGIGANTTVVTMLNAMLLRSLPVRDPARLAVIYTVDPHSAGLLGCSYPNYVDYRDRNPVFSSLALYSPLVMNLTGHGEAQSLMGAIVSGNYFSTLGVEPMIGRAFRPEEDASPGANPVTIVSYGLWNRLYAADPRVTSRAIRLNGHEFQIVGVAPEGFHGLNSMFAADVWVPLMMYPQVFPTPAVVNQRRALYFSAVGRLRPGVGMAQAETAMQAIAQDLERQWPKENHGYRLKLVPAAEAALATQTRNAVVNSGEVLMIVSGLVLLIACVNVANLLLARAAERNKEIAIRLALGASRWRLIRQLLTESALLAVAGGLAGLLVARWARDLLWSLRPPMFNHAAFRLDFDTRVLAYTLGISVCAGILFGLAPALRATRPDLAVDLKERSGRTAPRLGRWNLLSILVIEQVAFSLVTLVAAGLFIRSMRSASQIDPGFDAAHLATVGYNVADQGYSAARGREFQRAVLERVSTLPSVDGVTLAKDPPLKAAGARTVFLRGQENTAGGQGRLTLTNVVWPGYFRTMRIGLARGRDFSMLDTLDSPRVAIVNQAAAAVFWPGQEATGKSIEFGGENLPVEVVGVVRNATYRDFSEPPPAMIYLSMVQYYFPYGSVYIHSRGKPETALAEARKEIRKLDRNLVLQDETVETTIRETLWAQRLSGQLLGVFGLLALALSTIGIYGVVSYSVQRRVREIGIRMALGATAADVQAMVLNEGIRMVAAGVISGLAVSLATSHVVKNMLLVVGPRDALTFVLVPSILVLVAIFACWLPAHRATLVKPASALREE
jgi:predicted permease